MLCFLVTSYKPKNKVEPKFKCLLGESLTDKIQSFQRLRNFRRFRVFVLSYRANLTSWKRRSYLGKVFESLTNKIQSFQRIRNFRRFRVFVLSYRANSKSRKRREIANLVESKAILLQCVFWKCWLCFLFDRASLDMFFYYFPAFPAFSSNLPCLTII